MMEKCKVCGESAEEECLRCGSAIDVGHMGVMFNGYLAVEMDVCLCEGCDGCWLRMGGMNRVFICSKCRKKALRVEIEGPQVQKSPRKEAA